jgi:hypothetical protein
MNIITTPAPEITILLNNPPSAEQPLSIVERPAATIETTPIEQPLTLQRRGSASRIRNGKIARLPKLERDLVNRMLFNHLPYAKIVGALDELGINVTERNISNWKTRGGYKEWCTEQEHQLNLSRLQDNLVDYLRKNDAPQLPEVGLQLAATQLSHMLLQPDAVQQLTAHPEKYSKVVDMLCRLSTHIQSLQKDRDRAVDHAAIRGTSEQLKRANEEEIEATRQTYSSKSGDRPRDPEIPHRNELPKRDELPFRQPAPKLDLMAALKHLSNPIAPALPAPASGK